MRLVVGEEEGRAGHEAARAEEEGQIDAAEMDRAEGLPLEVVEVCLPRGGGAMTEKLDGEE